MNDKSYDQLSENELRSRLWDVIMAMTVEQREQFFAELARMGYTAGGAQG